MPRRLVEGGGATQALTPWDTIRFSITIDPSRQTVYYLGAGNSITFPAHSLCDRDQSSYGAGEWDKPCTQATSPVTVQRQGVDRPARDTRAWTSTSTSASCRRANPVAVGRADVRRLRGVARSVLQHSVLPAARRAVLRRIEDGSVAADGSQSAHRQGDAPHQALQRLQRRGRP